MRELKKLHATNQVVQLIQLCAAEIQKENRQAQTLIHFCKNTLLSNSYSQKVARMVERDPMDSSSSFPKWLHLTSPSDSMLIE